MHKVTAQLVDNLKEAQQYPLRDVPSNAFAGSRQNMNPKKLKQVAKFGDDMERHHTDRAYQHHMDSEQFPKGSDAYHAHHVAADANNAAAEHYATLRDRPQRTHDDIGGKRMKDVTHHANASSVSAHAEAEAYYDWNG